MGIELWVSPGAGSEADWRREITFWKEADVTHVTAHTNFPRGHHRRITSHSAADHLAAITRGAVANVVEKLGGVVSDLFNES